MATAKLVTVKLLSKDVIGLQKSTKQTKSISVAVPHIKICAEHIKPVRYTQFYTPKTQPWGTQAHTFLSNCRLADSDVSSFSQIDI